MVDFAFAKPYQTGQPVNIALSSPPPLGPLHVSGDQLLDVDNNPVKLAGTGIGDWQNTLTRTDVPSSVSISKEDIQHLASHGCRIIETNEIYWHDLEPSQNNFNQAMFAKLDNLLSWCSENQMYYLMCFQNLNNPWGMIPTWVTNPPPDITTEEQYYAFLKTWALGFLDRSNSAYEFSRTAFRDWMVYVVNRYKNNDYFLLCFFNEPLNAMGTYTYDKVKVSADYAHFNEWMYDEVMATGYRNPLIIDHPWCNFIPASSITPVNRSNIIWESHLYMSPQSLPTFEKWAHTGAGYPKSSVDDHIYSYHTVFGKPDFFGEYGWIDYSEEYCQINDWNPAWKTALQQMVNYLKSQPVCGYDWFAYSVLYGEYYDWYPVNWHGQPHCFSPENTELLLQTIFA